MPSVYLMYTSHDQHLVSVDITTFRLSLKTLKSRSSYTFGHQGSFIKDNFSTCGVVGVVLVRFP